MAQLALGGLALFLIRGMQSAQSSQSKSFFAGSAVFALKRSSWAVIHRPVQCARADLAMRAIRGEVLLDAVGVPVAVDEPQQRQEVQWASRFGTSIFDSIITVRPD